MAHLISPQNITIPYAAWALDVQDVWTATSDDDNGFAGVLQFGQHVEKIAGPGLVYVYVERTHGATGAVTVTVTGNSTTGVMAMTSGSNFDPISTVVAFADQEYGIKRVPVYINSVPASGLHLIHLTLTSPTGGSLVRNSEMHVLVDDGGLNPGAVTVAAGGDLQTAANSAAAGGLVYARSGADYTNNTRTSGEIAGFTLNNANGLPTSKIVLANYPGETPVINQNYLKCHDSGGEDKAAGFVVYASNLMIKGFEIENCLDSGIKSSGNGQSNVILLDNKIHDIGNPPNGIPDYTLESHADNLAGIRVDGFVNCQVVNTEIYDIYDVRVSSGQSNPWNAYAASGHSGVHGFYTTEILIEHCEFYRVAKAVFEKNPSDLDGQSRRVHHSKFSQIQHGALALQLAGSSQPGSHYPQFHHNLMNYTATGSEDAYGVEVQQAEAEVTSQANNLIVHNNTQVNGEELIRGASMTNISAYNNVHENCDANYALNGDHASGSGTNNFRYSDYNCFSNGTFRVLTSRYVSTVTYSTLTAWRGAYPGDTYTQLDADENSIETNPTYVNAGAGDYRTQTGVTVGTGRFSRDIGIGNENVGLK